MHPGTSLTDAIRSWATPRAEDSESAGIRHSRGDVDTLTGQSRLWATPKAMSGGANSKREERGAGGPDLQEMAGNWPTPDASMMNDGQTEEARARRKARELEKKYNGNGGGEPLAYRARVWQTPGTDSFRSRSGERKDEMGLDQQARFWPTPNALVSNDGETPESWERRRDKLKALGINGNGIGTPLTIAATMWPTPAARDFKGENGPEHLLNGSGRLHLDQLPNFVAFLFLPQAPPTKDGPTSSEPAQRSRPRLNPAFVCWLMGWPWWWTRAVPTSFGAPAMVLWRFRLQSHLCCLLGERLA